MMQFYSLENIYSHLEKTGSTVRLTFFDFSSAFNTIQPHLLVQKPLNMKIPSSVISWIFDYLTNRLQDVRLTGLLSSAINTNTGAPQGIVLAPYLFALYTADCRSTDESCPVVKFADDTELVGKIKYDEDAIYHKQIENFVNWCDKNYLYLNVSKTKERCIDFRKNQRCPTPVYIKGKAVKRVDTCKYLGVVFDSKLNWKENINSVLKKVNSRMYCMRKLRSFGVNSDMLVIFFIIL